MQGEKAIQRLNELKQSVDLYSIHSFDGSRLALTGSSDFGYGYNFKIEFLEASFIQCPTYFHAKHFRVANEAELNRFRHVLLDNEKHHIFCIESDDEQTYYIIAKDWILTEEMVKFYKVDEPSQ
jgi:hypothetical protein